MTLRPVVATLALCATLLACVSAQMSTMQSFSSGAGRFTVTVPGGTMNTSTLSTPRNGAFAGSTVSGFSTGSASGARFAILYADAAAGYLDAHGVGATLLDAEQANLATKSGTLVSDGPISVAGQSAREERINVGQVVYVFRLVFVGQRFYSISVTGSSAQVDAADAKVFLDSFTSP